MATKYSKATQEKVHEEMHEMKEGKLRSGGNGKKVTNPKQAVAIALSEARKEGKKVPPQKSSSPSKKTATKKTAAKKSAPAKKTAAKKSAPAKKTAGRKTASKKSAAPRKTAARK